MGSPLCQEAGQEHQPWSFKALNWLFPTCNTHPGQRWLIPDLWAKFGHMIVYNFWISCHWGKNWDLTWNLDVWFLKENQKLWPCGVHIPTWQQLAGTGSWLPPGGRASVLQFASPHPCLSPPYLCPVVHSTLPWVISTSLGTKMMWIMDCTFHVFLWSMCYFVCM